MTVDAGRQADVALEVVGIEKSFGAVRAVRGVSFAVRRGSIHGVAGENGAGKSTVMNMVYGCQPADRGTVRVMGRAVTPSRPADAIAAGIGMVHQHFMLVDAFTAVENLLLGAEGGGSLAGGAARARAALDRLARDYGLIVPADATAGEMSVGDRQRLEIAKALFRGAEILILDEPTAVLTPQEADGLFALLTALKAEGKTIIVVTHKLREILTYADRVTVMRRGRVAGERETAETTVDELAQLTVGRRLPPAEARIPVAAADDDDADAAPTLTAAGLRVWDDAGRERVRGIDFIIRPGEIVGVAGVSGAGQSELLAALAGVRPHAGRLTMNGREAPNALSGAAGVRFMRSLGVAHVPEDRMRDGMSASAPAYETILLGRQDEKRWNAGWRLRWGAVRRRCADLMAAYDVRPAAPDQSVGRFSGGNQQKLALAREIDRDPALLLAGQPTRGVDIGAAAFIHRRLLDLRAAGKSTLLVSAELDEIMALSDRILVMFDGRITGETTPADADARTLGLMMTGAVRES